MRTQFSDIAKLFYCVCFWPQLATLQLLCFRLQVHRLILWAFSVDLWNSGLTFCKLFLNLFVPATAWKQVHHQLLPQRLPWHQAMISRGVGASLTRHVFLFHFCIAMFRISVCILLLSRYHRLRLEGESFYRDSGEVLVQLTREVVDAHLWRHPDQAAQSPIQPGLFKLVLFLISKWYAVLLFVSFLFFLHEEYLFKSWVILCHWSAFYPWEEGKILCIFESVFYFFSGVE